MASTTSRLQPDLRRGFPNCGDRPRDRILPRDFRHQIVFMHAAKLLIVAGSLFFGGVVHDFPLVRNHCVVSFWPRAESCVETTGRSCARVRSHVALDKPEPRVSVSSPHGRVIRCSWLGYVTFGSRKVAQASNARKVMLTRAVPFPAVPGRAVPCRLGRAVPCLAVLGRAVPCRVGRAVPSCFLASYVLVGSALALAMRIATRRYRGRPFVNCLKAVASVLTSLMRALMCNSRECKRESRVGRQGVAPPYRHYPTVSLSYPPG